LIVAITVGFVWSLRRYRFELNGDMLTLVGANGPRRFTVPYLDSIQLGRLPNRFERIADFCEKFHLSTSTGGVAAADRAGTLVVRELTGRETILVDFLRAFEPESFTAVVQALADRGVKVIAAAL
jgi:hypothetical protein